MAYRTDLMVVRVPEDEVGDLDVGSFLSAIASGVKSVGKAAVSVAKGATNVVGRGVSLAGKVPFVGSGIKGVATMTVGAPFAVANKVLSGQRLDRVALNTLKEQVRAAKDVAPYAQTVLSFVPGVGQGMSGVIGASMALASGQPITDALVEGVRGALPGGPLAKAAFDIGTAVMQGKRVDQVALAALPLTPQQKQIVAAGLSTAKALAHGQRVDQALLDNALRVLPPDAQKAVTVGMALAHGRVLQAVKTASTLAKIPGMSVPDSARNLYGQVTNPLTAPLRRNVVQTLHPDLARVATGLARNPVMLNAPNTQIARKFGVPLVMAQRARSAAQGMRWKPLSPRASNFVRSVTPYASMRSLTDTRGLSPDGLVYVVEKGDYAERIAKKLTGKDGQGQVLIAANPQKKTVSTSYGKNFATLNAGEKLIVPKAWQKPVAVASPGTAVASAPAVTVNDPQRANTAAILQAKGLLVTWTKTDGAKEAGFPDYGMNPADLSTTFGERDRFILASFEDWSNRTRGTRLPTDGMLTEESGAALRDWAEKRVAVLSPPAEPAREVPAVSVPAVVSVPQLPGIIPTMAPPTDTAPAVSVSVPPLPTVTVTPNPDAPPTPIDLPTMTIEESAPVKPKKDDFTLAIAGAAAGGLIAGITGAALGGGAGFLLDSLMRVPVPKQA